MTTVKKRLLFGVWCVLMGVWVVCGFGADRVAASGAVGCEHRALLPVGRSSEHTLVVDDLVRIYRVYLPSSYDGTHALPVVMGLHGTMGAAADHETESGWSAVAEAENFIVVYPQGIRPTFFKWAWNAGMPLDGEDRTPSKTLSGDWIVADDVAFFDTLITHLAKTLCIDTHRVYVTGHSNGGGMTNHLACALSDKITGIGTNAGAYTPIEGGCNPVRAMPVIAFQGLQDQFVPVSGRDDLQLTGVEPWAAAWAARNGCGDRQIAIDGLAETITAYRYAGCDDGVEVAVYLLKDGGHTLPGGNNGTPLLLGKTNTDISAAATMWAFLSRYSLQ